MSSTRKSRSVNKRFLKVNEESPDKDGGTGNKSRNRKRKLSDMLGSQWSKEELERFYEAYRKYGKDWKKVAGVVRHRTTEMVEALYNMNRAYLSLPEGTASVVGLIAMMTDHYNILEGTESDHESNDAPGVSRKPQKRGRGKGQVNSSRGMHTIVPDLLNFPSLSPNHGCSSLLKKKRSGGSRPRAVGKRTPRFPVYTYDKHDMQQFVSPNKRDSKSDLDAHDDEVAHGAVLVLAEALQRGGSPQSRVPKRSSELRNNDRRTGSEMEGSLESREAENGDFARDSSYMMDTEGFGTVEVKKKGKKFYGKKPKIQDVENNHVDDVREACSATEGLNLSSAREKVEDEVMDSKFGRSSPRGPRKRSRQLLFEDESAALDALYTLADVSLRSTVDSESSVQFKDREGKRTFDVADKSSVPETSPASFQRNKPKMSGVKEQAQYSLTGLDMPALKNPKLGKSLDFTSQSEARKVPSQTITKIRKQKQKPLASKSPRKEEHAESVPREPLKTEVFAEDGKKSMVKARRVGSVASLPKQGRSLRPPELSSSSTDTLRPGADVASSAIQIPLINQVNLPTKLRSRRKMDLPKALVHRESNSPENISKTSSLHDKTLDVKEKLSRCLSSQMFRRWCAYEWFYSAIDYPWFAKKEFVEYLNHVGLGHVPRLTRVEWGVIRSSLGKPRRLSEQFLREEKEKLEQYRESVRTHYTELRAGTREGLPTDLARPLSVGQRVIACHPRTREFHDGSVLTVDRNRCRIQFDRPELGVEFVMDIDCMPQNPSDNMPEALKIQNITSNRSCENVNDPESQTQDLKVGRLITLAESPDTANSASQISLPVYPLNTSLKQGDTSNAVSQARAAGNENFNSQKAPYTQPCTLAQIQAREDDIRALSDLTRALEKKEALVLELKHMNDEVYENQKDGDNSLKDYDPFKKQYATVLIQLKEANDQVSSALLYLRQRNTYQGNSPPPWSKPRGSSVAPVGPNSIDQSLFHLQESGSHVDQILEGSRLKSHTMVDAAVQALSTLKEGEDAFVRIGEAIDSAMNCQNGTDSVITTVRPFPSSDQVNGNLPYQEAANYYTSELTKAVRANGTKHTNTTSDKTEIQVPKELISSCIATFIMIQTCTERQYPPAEVAQILDSAVTSLQPCSSQNLPIYREIQMCMGLLKNQILALIPT